MMFLHFLVVVIFSSTGADRNVFNVGGIFPANDEREEIFNFAIKTLNDKQTDVLEVLPIVRQESSLNPLQSIKSACDLLSNGIVGIFGSLDVAENGEAIRSLCDNKEMPLFETRWDYDPPRSTSVVNFYPYPKVLGEVYVALVQSLDWKTFTILYEDNDSLIRISEILKMKQGEEKKTVLLHQLQDADGTGDYRISLKEAWKSGQKHFLLDCSIQTLETVLHQAQQIGLITNKFNFLITNPDFHTLDLEPYRYSETNITSVRFINPDSEEYTNQIANLQEDPGLERMSEVLKLETALLLDAVKVLGSVLPDFQDYKLKPLACDATDYWEHGYSIVNMIKTGTFNGLTGPIKFDAEGFRSEFNLEVIELLESGVVPIGSWDNTNGLKISRVERNVGEPYEHALRNRTFKVITCLTAPYGMLIKSENRLFGNEQYEGFGIDLIDELAQLEGFNYTFLIREDKKNGAKDPITQKWSGMIGDVMDGTADLAITDLTITSDREEAVDFTPPFMNLGISILYTKPTKAPPKFFSFAAPFGLEVWLSLSGAYFLVSVALFVAGRLSSDEWTNPYPCVEEPEYLINQFSIRNSFWFTIGSLMQQGTEIAPIAISTRMIAGLWWFFTLIMVSSYTANLAAFLTTENPDAHFTNVQELVERAPTKGIQYGAKLGGATYNFFANSQDPLFKQIGDYMSNHKEAMVSENMEGVERAEMGLYAFFMESTSIEYETERKCNLAQVGNLLDDKGYGIAMRKDSPYRQALSMAILKLQSSGKIRDLKQRWWQERHGGGQCSGEEDEASAVPLNLKSVEGVFYVTVGGVIFAAVLVIIEMVLHNLGVAMRGKTSFMHAVKDEALFYMKFGENVKPVANRSCSESPSQSKELNKSTETLPYGFVPEIAKD